MTALQSVFLVGH